MIEKKSEISSERADAENSRGPLIEATQDSEQTKNELGTRGPRGEATPGLVDDKGTVAEGDSCTLTTSETSAAVPGTGETETSQNSSERAAGGKGDNSVIEKTSNLAGNPTPDVSVVKEEGQECVAVEETVRPKSAQKRKPKDTPKSETSNEDAKKFKINTDEGEAPIQQICKSEEVESGDDANADNSVTAEVDENESVISDRLPRLAVVVEDFPDVKMTEEQAEVVETLLVERIRLFDQGQPIQISETQYENGALLFTCVNKKTHAWLYRTVPKLVPWPGARLEVGISELALKGAKFVMWVNDRNGVSKRNYQQILELIEKQNKEISTTEWIVMRGVLEGEKTERLVLWVDNKSLEDLKERNFKLFLGLDQVKFMKMSEWKKLNTSSPAAQNLSRPVSNNKQHRPFVSKFAYRNFPTALLPGSVSRPVLRSRGRGLSFQNLHSHFNRFEHRGQPQHRNFTFVNTGPHLRGAQFTAAGIESSRGRTYTNRESRFPDSRHPYSRRFPTSERSQSPEASYVRRESRYTSDRPQERRYSTLDRQQRRDRL